MNHLSGLSINVKYQTSNLLVLTLVAAVDFSCCRLGFFPLLFQIVCYALSKSDALSTISHSVSLAQRMLTANLSLFKFELQCHSKISSSP